MSRPSAMPGNPASRQSIYAPYQSTQSSTASSFGASASSNASSSRLQAKQEELEGLKQLKEYSAKLVRELEKMGEGLDGVRRGGESFAQVMSAWQTVFRGILVAQSSVQQSSQAANESGDPDEEAERLANLVPDTLVRIPVEQDLSTHATRDGEGAEGLAE